MQVECGEIQKVFLKCIYEKKKIKKNTQRDEMFKP